MNQQQFEKRAEEFSKQIYQILKELSGGSIDNDEWLCFMSALMRQMFLGLEWAQRHDTPELIIPFIDKLKEELESFEKTYS